MRAILALILATLLAVPWPLAAQADPWQNLTLGRPGDRVRLELTGGAVLEGRLVELQPDAVIVDNIDTGGRSISLMNSRVEGRPSATRVHRPEIRAAFVTSKAFEYRRTEGQAPNVAAALVTIRQLGSGRTVDVQTTSRRKFRGHIVAADNAGLTISHGTRPTVTTIPLDEVTRIKPAGLHWGAKTAMVAGIAVAAPKIFILLCMAANSCAG